MTDASAIEVIADELGHIRKILERVVEADEHGHARLGCAIEWLAVPHAARLADTTQTPAGVAVAIKQTGRGLFFLAEINRPIVYDWVGIPSLAVARQKCDSLNRGLESPRYKVCALVEA